MTLFEVGICIAVVMVLIIIFRPVLRSPYRRPSGINCINNLKQVGLAYKIWAGDNGDVLPMGISATNGGAMEAVYAGNLLQTFLVMSNELSTPRVLYCPDDKFRSAAASFMSPVGNNNISYFVGADTTNDMRPQMFLSGDCHFNVSLPASTATSVLAAISTNFSVGWNSARHLGKGNICLADGSVQQTDSSRLQFFLEQTGLATNRFVMPFP